MKIDRLVGILTILLQKDKSTIPELADRFEVSQRTISRDIDDLCRAGIPLVTMQGHGGGVAVAEGFQIDRSLLKQDELEAIFAGLSGIDSVSPVPYSAALSEKLSGEALHTSSDGTMRICLSSFSKDPLMQKIAAIRTAMREKRRITFRYFYSKGECTRTVEPYSLLYQWSAWYVWGRCLLRQDFRLFKLDRLWDLAITEDPFDAVPLPVPLHDMNGFLASGNFHLRARFSPAAKYRLIEEYGPDCFTQTESGLLLLERDFASYDNLREWVLSFGDQAEVLEPPQLREDLRQQAENLLRQYSQT